MTDTQSSTNPLLGIAVDALIDYAAVAPEHVVPAVRELVRRTDAALEAAVAPEASFKAIGTHGLVVQGQSIQVIIGLTVPQVREKFESLL